MKITKARQEGKGQIYVTLLIRLYDIVAPLRTGMRRNKIIRLVK